MEFLEVRVNPASIDPLVAGKITPLVPQSQRHYLPPMDLTQQAGRGSGTTPSSPQAQYKSRSWYISNPGSGKAQTRADIRTERNEARPRRTGNLLAVFSTCKWNTHSP